MKNEMIKSEDAEREELIELPITTVLGEPVTSKPKTVDEEMVKKATEGDKVAFEKLFMATYGYVYLIAKKRLSHDEDIYDAIQETFTKVYKNLSRLSSAAAFLSWLKTITENTVTDILRKAPPETEEFFEEYAEVDENYNSKNFDREISLDITEVLSNMSGDKVDLLIRVYYDGMTVTDIAKKEGVPKTTVYSRLAAAKKELKELLRIRGITKSMYGGSVVAMFATAIRNAIGTDLLSLAVAEEILHAVISGDKKRAAVIGTIARKQRNEAAMKIASGILVFCGVICALLVMTLYHLSGGFKFGVDSNDSLPEVGENSSVETVWDKLFGKDNSSEESSSNTSDTASESSFHTSSEDISSEFSSSSPSSDSSDVLTSSSDSSSAGNSYDNQSSNSSSSNSGVFIPDCNPSEYNVLGRHLDNGIIASQGDWIYGSCGVVFNSKFDGLFKIKKDGTGFKNILNGVAYDLNVVGDWIYYLNESHYIERIRTDGKQRQVVFNDYSVKDLTVVGNYAYFKSYGKNTNTGTIYKYYRLSLNTLEVSKLMDADSFVFTWVDEDRAFIVDKENNALYRYFPETDTKELWYNNITINGCFTGTYYVADRIYNLRNKTTPIEFDDVESVYMSKFYPSDYGNKIYMCYYRSNNSGSGPPSSLVVGSYNLATGEFVEHSDPYSLYDEVDLNMVHYNVFDGYLYGFSCDGYLVRVKPDGTDYKKYK